jgi:hypothetical protein
MSVKEDFTFYENLTPFKLSEYSKKKFRLEILPIFNSVVEHNLIIDNLKLPELAFLAKRLLANDLSISSQTSNKQYGIVKVQQKGIEVANFLNSKGEEFCILWFCKKLFDKYPNLLEY